MASVKILLEKGREYKKGGYPLVVQVLHKRCKRVIYLGYGIKENLFDYAKEQVIYSPEGVFTVKEVRNINSKAKEIKNEILQKITYLEQKHESYTLKDIFYQFQTGQKMKYLYAFFEYEINKLNEYGKIGTAKSYQWTLNSIKKHLGDKDILFANITAGVIRDYRDKLKGGKISENTVNFYLHNLHAVYNKALGKGIKCSPSNPFQFLHIKPQKTVKRALTGREIKQISELDLKNDPKRDIARDIFMFSFYTRGMSFIDIILLKHTDIQNGTITYRRSKTGQLLQVKVTSQINEIIKKYISDSIYVFGLVEGKEADEIYKSYKNAYTRINRNLKKIAERLSLGITLTTYVAKHSWATIAKLKGISIATISEGLGHTSGATTAIYLKELDQSIINEANDLVCVM